MLTVPGRHQTAIVVVAACVTALITGCGSSTTRHDSSSKPEKAVVVWHAYVRRVNGVCHTYNRRIARVGPPAGSLKQQAAIAHRINVLALEELRAVRRVHMPPGDLHEITAALAQAERGIRSADESTRLILAGQIARANGAAGNGFDRVTDANQRFAELGFAECAK